MRHPYIHPATAEEAFTTVLSFPCWCVKQKHTGFSSQSCYTWYSLKESSYASYAVLPAKQQWQTSKTETSVFFWQRKHQLKWGCPLSQASQSPFLLFPPTQSCTWRIKSNECFQHMDFYDKKPQKERESKGLSAKINLELTWFIWKLTKCCLVRVIIEEHL